MSIACQNSMKWQDRQDTNHMSVAWADSLQVIIHLTCLIEQHMIGVNIEVLQLPPWQRTEWCCGDTRPVQGRWILTKCFWIYLADNMVSWCLSWSSVCICLPCPSMVKCMYLSPISHGQMEDHGGISKGHGREAMWEGVTLTRSKKVERLYSREL